MAESDAGSHREQRRIQVLWLVKGLGPGGAERLLTLSARLRDRDRLSVRAAYLLPAKDMLVADLEAEGVPAMCLGAGSSWDPRWVGRLRQVLAGGTVDVVHVHSPLAAIGARAARASLPAGRRPRLVTTEHNQWDSHAWLTARLDALTGGLDDAHLAVSEAVRASMPARLRTRTEVVRYGVDVAEVRAASAARDEMRQALGVARDDVLIGTVANLRATKGYPDLLDAARAVIDRAPTARFVAVGQGPLERELRSRHAELGLGSRFEFLGYRDDAVRVMAAFDVLCMSSRHEGLPVAIMEALVLGRPIVATAVGGVPELVTDGREAVLVPPARPDRLATALVELVADPNRRADMAARARERGADLDLVRAVRRTEAVYAEVLAR